jgi:hypothetical protein
MGGIIGVLIGLPVAVFGFCTMRNPMRFTLLSPWSEGYYQRMVLDTTMRNQLRVLGVLVCLFGSGILTASLGSVLRANFLEATSEGLWVLMGVIFFSAWGFGLILAVRQLFKGQLFDWFRVWKTSVQLGPIDVFPPITPKMQREAKLFTATLLTLAGIAAMASLSSLADVISDFTHNPAGAALWGAKLMVIGQSPVELESGGSLLSVVRARSG